MKVCLEITLCRRVTAKPRVSHQHHQPDQRNDGSEVAKQEERHEKKSLVSVRNNVQESTSELSHSYKSRFVELGSWKLETAPRRC